MSGNLIEYLVLCMPPSTWYNIYQVLIGRRPGSLFSQHTILPCVNSKIVVAKFCFFFCQPTIIVYRLELSGLLFWAKLSMCCKLELSTPARALATCCAVALWRNIWSKPLIPLLLSKSNCPRVIYWLRVVGLDEVESECMLPGIRYCVWCCKL